MRKAALLALALVIACADGAEQQPTTTPGPELPPSSVATTTGSTMTATSAVVSATTTTPVAVLTGLALTEVATGLPFPVMMVARPSDGVLFLATKDGQIWSLESGNPVAVMDISDRVRNSGEQGLLGMDFSPVDPDRLFLHYSDGNGNTVVSEFRGFDPGSERVIFTLGQPASNHNGGTLTFGPEGLLWLGLGDGGGGGDTFGTGQTTDDLLAGILRLDPEEDQPAPEVWAIGLRNPWRFSIDEGLVYIGDVGQNAFEEINVAPADAASLNYGWPITEGHHCFEPAQGCNTEGLTLPVVEVAHSDAGTCSITGGMVYRGVAIPEIVGHYFYSDFCGGWVRSFRYQDGAATAPQDWTDQVGNPGNVVSFARDQNGELYLLTDSRILRLDPVR